MILHQGQGSRSNYSYLVIKEALPDKIEQDDSKGAEDSRTITTYDTSNYEAKASTCLVILSRFRFVEPCNYDRI